MTRGQGDLLVHEVSLSDNAQRLLAEAARDFPDELRVGREAEALDVLEEWGQNLRSDLMNKDETSFKMLDGLAQNDDHHAVVLLHTADISGEYPATPSDYLLPEENRLHGRDLERALMIGALGLHGHGFSSQQNGVIFNNMLLAESARGRANNASTPGELGMHTEDAYFCDTEGGISPDVLSLHYRRNFEEVGTPVATFDIEALDALKIGSASVLDILREARFTSPTSSAHQATAALERSSILYGTNGDQLRFNVPLMLGEEGQKLHDKESILAMRALSRHLDQRTVHLIPQSGDMLWINNRHATHGKALQTTFVEQGLNRWQSRMNLVIDLGRVARFMVRPRIVDPNLYTEYLRRRYKVAA